MSLKDQADNKLALNILGWLSHHEQNPPRLNKEIEYKLHDAWVCSGHLKYFDETGNWVPGNTFGHPLVDFGSLYDLIRLAQCKLKLNWRGVLNGELPLPAAEHFFLNDAWGYKGDLWKITSEGWVQVDPPVPQEEKLELKELGEASNDQELPPAGYFTPGDGLYWRGTWWMVNREMTWEKYKPPGSIFIIGDYPSGQELPDANNYDLNDGFMWRGGVWINNPKGTWFNPELQGPGPTAAEPAMDKLFSEMVDIFEKNNEPLFNILGRVSGFPIPKGDYSLRDAFIVTQDYSEELWAWSDDGEGKSGWLQVAPKHAQRIIVAHDHRQSLLNHKHTGVTNDGVTTGPFDDGMDAGSMARQLMEHKAELKRLKRSRLINKLAIWFVFLGVLVALGIAAYGYVQRDLKSGFDTTFRDCEIMVGELKITGKRTYSYPYKALWGQRWVDETRVRESTTINLPGVKLAIVADAEPKWWGLRFSDGERGSPILKPALKYTLVTDKGIAMMSYGGFCKPANALPVADDSKSPERTIIN